MRLIARTHKQKWSESQLRGGYLIVGRVELILSWHPRRYVIFDIHVRNWFWWCFHSRTWWKPWTFTRKKIVSRSQHIRRLT